MELKKQLTEDPALARLASGEETVWINPGRVPFTRVSLPFGPDEVADASARLARFAPLLRTLFPETGDGMIESPLTEIPAMGARLGADRLYLKRDSDLAVAGSVKARGGIYEVLKHSETLALEAGLLTGYDDDYTKLATPEARVFFAARKVQVGSTGNLGVSIGIMSAALGYQAVVHMSADAKQWKKDYLRAHGVTVIEYAGDYGKAVEQGRAQSDADPMSYFVDDENSKDLFFGYAVAAERLDRQLAAANVTVDPDHPLFVYIPCGVGGAPGGIAFGLKLLYGDGVHVFFVEPTQAPCMLLGLATGLHSAVCVQDIGLTGLTHADGLAVGRPSGFVGRLMAPLLSGEMTVADGRLYDYLRQLWDSEGLFIEPSACAAFRGAEAAVSAPEMADYARENGLDMASVTHIAWATGGALVPQEQRELFLQTHL
ncbi:MAG: D-serine ammonia-lyase [Oscillospiraceae bacterium]|nr:D-serine ammonia-lyase [Oscillospiraceae bacterium]